MLCFLKHLRVSLSLITTWHTGQICSLSLPLGTLKQRFCLLWLFVAQSVVPSMAWTLTAVNKYLFTGDSEQNVVLIRMELGGKP